MVKSLICRLLSVPRVEQRCSDTYLSWIVTFVTFERVKPKLRLSWVSCCVSLSLHVFK